MTQSTIRKTWSVVRKTCSILSFALFCLALPPAAPAVAAGFSLIEVPSDAGPALGGGVWYPCATPPGEIAVGLVTVRAAKDCPIAGRDLPLVVISHGFGGSFVGHRDVAEALADAGFIVAAINHPSDSSRSPEHDHKDPLSALTDRPADIKRLVDFMLGAWLSAAKIDRDRIGFFGGKVRVLSIPAIRDRVAQGALKLILEPIFEADFQSGSFGYRPQRTAHEAVDRVARAIVQYKTRVIDIDLRSYLDAASYCPQAY